MKRKKQLEKALSGYSIYPGAPSLRPLPAQYQGDDERKPIDHIIYLGVERALCQLIYNGSDESAASCLSDLFDLCTSSSDSVQLIDNWPIGGEFQIAYAFLNRYGVFTVAIYDEQTGNFIYCQA